MRPSRSNCEMLWRLPNVVPIETPMECVFSSVIWRLASSIASFAAELISLVLLSRVRSPFLPRNETGSKSLISPAIWTLKGMYQRGLLF